MSNIPFVVEIDSHESFQQNVIDKSLQLPVVVDFWAEWCQPCQVLIPLLTDIAQQYQGAFILAKINSDELQDLAVQHGVKSLPTVLIYHQGQVVDSFTGAIPEGEIKTLINKYVANPVNDVLEQALILLDQGDSENALEQLKQLNQQSPENYKVHLAIAQVYLQTKEYPLCEDLLSSLPDKIQLEEAYKSIKTQLEIAQAVANAPELDDLEQQIKAEPDNLDLQLQLANIHIANQNHADALEILFQIVKKDISFNEGVAKANMLKVFDILGSSNALVRQYRKKLFSFLN
ncbi:MAG: tetratricopeptide repeat protein [Pseudomonadota bacterium]